MENILEYLEAATMIVGGFAVLATLTKNESDNVVVDWTLKIINFLAMNFGRARNR